MIYTKKNNIIYMQTENYPSLRSLLNDKIIHKEKNMIVCFIRRNTIFTL